ncbi:cold shock domain-containing protein [Omnitrophica bacterium]|nr:cold shock domain-containing protein [Candidatus Omnitrophota bacterium]
MVYTGTIKKVVRQRGFGFISARDGREIFFHRRSLETLDFEMLAEDQKVEFEVEKTYKGPSAFNMRLIEEPA